MHTMQLQPGRCRGCLVVAHASLGFAPNTATVANASNPVGSTFGSWVPQFSATFRFLDSVKE